MKTLKFILPILMIFAASLPSFSATVDIVDPNPTIELAYVDAAIDQVKNEAIVEAPLEYISYQVQPVDFSFLIKDGVEALELSNDLQPYAPFENHYKPIIDPGFRWITSQNKFMTNSHRLVSIITPAKRTGERLLLRA